LKVIDQGPEIRTEPHTFGKWWQRLISSPEAGPLIGFISVYLLFAMIGPDTFLTMRNLQAIIRQTTIVGIAAIGMTIVIIGGGIDLSIGSIVALVTVCMALLLQAGIAPALALLAGILVGSLCGALNGALITKLRVVPFIVTLGTLLFFRGVAKGMSGEQKVDAPLSWLNEFLAVLNPQDSWRIFPTGVWIMIVLAILVFVMLKYTRMGLHMYALGSNEQTATLCGVPVSKVKLLLYVFSGLFAGIAGSMQFSRLTVGDPTVAVGLELDAIAAVVIGGGSLRGGEGSVLGTILGALIMTVIRSGCSQIGLASWVQEIVAGVIITGAVALDQLRHAKVCSS
jgi:ribose/xylose/arabinose/galactoside ABC-type transport system permease subunit